MDNYKTHTPRALYEAFEGNRRSIGATHVQKAYH
jgi:hypothetical protein